MSSEKAVLSYRINLARWRNAGGVLILEFVAQRLRELRRRHGLTQEQVASLLGTDLRWYQRVELKEKDIRASTIDRLAAIYGVAPIDFLAKAMPETTLAVRPASTPHKPRQADAKKPRRK